MVYLAQVPYREQVQALVAWCSDSHPYPNTKKTKEIIRLAEVKDPTTLRLEYQWGRSGAGHKFLGLHISEDLGWTASIPHIIKNVAQLRLFFLRTLRRNKLPPPLLKNF